MLKIAERRIRLINFEFLGAFFLEFVRFFFLVENYFIPNMMRNQGETNGWINFKNEKKNTQHIMSET